MFEMMKISMKLIYLFVGAKRKCGAGDLFEFNSIILVENLFEMKENVLILNAPLLENRTFGEENKKKLLSIRMRRSVN